MGHIYFLFSCGCKTPEQIELKFCMIDYVQHATPRAKIDTRHFSGTGWDYKEWAKD